jgi:predicted amidohydrolase YtcJ
MTHAELIFTNGVIHTMDFMRDVPRAEAVATANGRILAVGTLAEVEATTNAKTKRIDLAGRTLIPGLNDAHVHVWKVGLLLTTMLDARPAATPDIPSIVAAFRARAATVPAGTWLTGRGYNNVVLPEHRHPTCADLDAASTAHPIVLIHTSAHAAAVNSLALQLAGITRDTPDPEGGHIERDEHGEPTGVLHETAMAAVNRVQPPASDTEFAAAVFAAMQSYARLGFTSVTDPGVNPEQLAVYRQLAQSDSLPIRANVMARRHTDDGATVALPERFEYPMLRIDTVKLFADGGLSSGNAAISVPYRHDSSTRGLLRVSDEQMRGDVLDIHRAGLRVAIHAVGDRAIEQVIDAMERAYDHGYMMHDGRRVLHRIEHFGLPNADHLRRCKDRISIVPQQIFIHALGSTFLNYVPDELLPRLYPLRTILDAGLTVALSSDAPVVPDYSAFAGMKAAADRQTADGRIISPEQAVSPAETLPLYTLGGAVVAGEDHLKGSITPGKYADLCVLSHDPTTTPVEALTDIRAHMTILAGKIIYTA